tara:strand:- start:133 stop:579 length:447 start_codon:yes stop_codon:yes gene_type:complete
MNFTLIQKNLSKDYVPIVLNVFNKNKTWVKESITKNCKLTSDIKDKLPNELIKEITEPFFSSDLLHYAHVLKFSSTGVLDYHDHKLFETFSFVLYLDNVGGTVFKTDEDEIFIHSRPNRLVLFDSKIMHKAINDGKERMIVGGGIIKK